ncbi:MAG: hypothetical protein KGM96_07980 [Acidobacteriota bacterium]|nr:hypothetical protein [Acidobacteriota bacterium]
MKLRIKGNSLRLRVSPSEMARLMQVGRIEGTIRFAIEDDAKLTYALEHSAAQAEMSVRYRLQEVTVTLSTEDAHRWLEGKQVGLHREYAIGGELLVVLVEKDFACLDGSDADNADAFVNPKHGTDCPRSQI